MQLVLFCKIGATCIHCMLKRLRVLFCAVRVLLLAKISNVVCRHNLECFYVSCKASCLNPIRHEDCSFMSQKMIDVNGIRCGFSIRKKGKPTLLC
jgi:hypothetical protein